MSYAAYSKTEASMHCVKEKKKFERKESETKNNSIKMIDEDQKERK